MDADSTRKFTSYTPAEMRELYETDPSRFRAMAAEALRDACVGRTDEETVKLRQMQWVIEGKLRKQKTPQQKLQEMQKIFYDQLYGDNGLIFRLDAACTRLAQILKETGSTGNEKPVLRGREPGCW